MRVKNVLWNAALVFFVIVMMRTFSLSPLAMIIHILGMELFLVST